MPNQNLFEAREELKMAQCDLSLSYSPCKTEERFCKLSYSSWCPTCDKDSPRRRSKSETNETCRKKGREMKGTSKRYDWNPECENMELEYETKDMRYDTCRIRSNLCELPTTYIANNCQMIKLSNCTTDFIDSSEKGVKWYENSLKSSDLSNQHPNLSGMVDKQDRVSKFFSGIEEPTKNVHGIVNKIQTRLDNFKPHLNHIPPPASAPSHIDNRSSKPTKLNNKPLKPIKPNGGIVHIEPLFNHHSLSPRHNELYNLELRNRSHTPRSSKQNERPLEISPLKHPLKPSTSPDKDLHQPIQYDTCSYFDKKIDIATIKERYTREVEMLKEKLRDLKNNAYDNHMKSSKPQSAPPKNDAPTTKWPPFIEHYGDLKREFTRIQEAPKMTRPITGAVPKLPLKLPQKEPIQLTQKKSERLKATSKVSLKTKSKLNLAKMKKPKLKSSSTTNTNILDSDSSDSEDSDKDDDTPTTDESTSVESTTYTTTSSSKRDAKEEERILLQALGSGDSLHWPIRDSLFPHMPPYLSFTNFDASTPKKVPFARFLKWKMSTITPILVRKTLTNSGFRLVRKSDDWLGTWGKHMKSPMFRTLKETQKLNHFPGTFQIGRKDRLWRNLQKLINKHGHREFGFTPRTYVLPQDLKLLKQHWQLKNTGEEKYIIKPPALARGTGIKIINRWAELPKRMALVVQEYISNPYLINGSKFDLRLYVLVTSFNPLRIYLYPDGLARFASVPYSDDDKDLKDRFMHLTNYSINKLSSLYTANEDANACKGHKWTLSKLWEYLEKTGVNTKALWKELQQLVIKTMICGESSITPLCKEHLNSRYNCYELFGIDVLLDEHLRAWLLEVNISPSLHSQSPLDEHVKGPMVKNLFDLVQFHLPPKLRRMHRKLVPPCLDPKLYTTGLTKKERNKHNYFNQADSRDEYLAEILNDLTGDDVRHLTQAEDELTVTGQFERIFPTSQSYKYLEFLDVRYYNRLFDAWEHKYEKNRQPGIEILQSLCEQRIHLKVAPPPSLTKALYKADIIENTQPPLQNSLNLIPAGLGQPKEELKALPSILPPPPPFAFVPNGTTPPDLGKLNSSKPPVHLQNLCEVFRLQSEKMAMMRPLPVSNLSTQA